MFIWFSTFAFHDDERGPTFVSTETILNRNSRGQTSKHLPQSGGRSVIWNTMEQAKEGHVRRVSF